MSFSISIELLAKVAEALSIRVERIKACCSVPVRPPKENRNHSGVESLCVTGIVNGKVGHISLSYSKVSQSLLLHVTEDGPIG